MHRYVQFYTKYSLEKKKENTLHQIWANNWLVTFSIFLMNNQLRRALSAPLQRMNPSQEKTEKNVF